MSLTKRFLSVVLKDFLDANLSTGTIEPLSCFLEAANACVGIMEEGGDNHGKMVEAFQATIGGAHGQPWCLSFIQSMIAYVEDRFNVTSNLVLTELCLKLLDDTNISDRFTDPKTGDIVIWQYGETAKGHCGIVIKSDYKVINTIEGNTSPSVFVDREGDGVYQKTRSITGTSNMHVVGFIRPKFIDLAAIG